MRQHTFSIQYSKLGPCAGYTFNMGLKVVIVMVLIHCLAATQMEDFPACGFRNECDCGQRDECLWDCSWVPNPFYRTQWTVDLVDEDLKDPENPESGFSGSGSGYGPDESVVFENVKYFMTTPKIPKDISCLDGCRLREVVSCIQR